MQPEVFGVEPQFQSQAGDHLALDPGAVVLDVLEQGRLDASVYMPWLLNGASPQVQDTLMGKFPPPLLTAYREQWAPAYAALTIWPATSSDKGRRPRI